LLQPENLNNDIQHHSFKIMTALNIEAYIYVHVVLHTSSPFYNFLTYSDIQRTVHRDIFL